MKSYEIKTYKRPTVVTVYSKDPYDNGQLDLMSVHYATFPKTVLRLLWPGPFELSDFSVSHNLTKDPGVYHISLPGCHCVFFRDPLT